MSALRLLPATIVGLILLFLVFPIVVVMVVSFSSEPYLTFPPPAFGLRWYRAYFSNADWLRPTFLSLWVAAATVILSTTLGTIAAMGIARLPRALRLLVAGLVLLGEGLALTMDGARPWVPPGRRLVKQLVLERFYGNAATLGGRLLTGTIRVVIGQLLFVLGLVLVGFGALELTRVP